MDNQKMVMVRMWREVAQNWMGEGLSRQSITEKLVLAVGPLITREVLRELPEDRRSGIDKEWLLWDGAQR